MYENINNLTTVALSYAIIRLTHKDPIVIEGVEHEVIDLAAMLQNR